MRARIAVRLALTPFTALVIAACGAAPADDASSDRASDGAPNAAAGTSSAARGPARPLPEGAVMLQRVNILDPGVIAASTAMTALVPQGWSARGGVVPGAGLCSDPYGVDWFATSADGLSSLSIFPTEVWQTTNTGVRGDCREASFSSAREYLEARVAQVFADAQVVEYRDRPDFAHSARDNARQTEAMAQQMGLQLSAKAEGGEVLFTYRQGGSAMRGVMGVSAVFYMTSLMNPMGGPPLTSLSASTRGTFAATAPEGQLNLELVEASRRSITPNAAWLAQLFALQNKLGGIAAQGTRERAAIIVAGGAAATKANIESFRIASGANRRGASGELYPAEASSDRMQRASIEAIRGVDTYLDPVSNSPVQLDHTYGNAWRVSNQDAYILTKDPNFNPGQYGIEATRMQVVK